MKIALFGGTGFVGSHVVDALVAAQHDVSLLVRPGSEHKIPSTTVWRTTPGDLNNAEALDETVLGCDAVIYSVGLLREFPKRHITFENTQFEGVVGAAAAAKRANIQRFILISANGIKMPGTPYQETKLRAEEHINASGLNGTIFRPSVIFGDPKGTMEFATQLFRDMVASPLPALGFFSGLSPNSGQILNLNMMDYKWRSFAELPRFENEILETPMQTHRYKAIGVGEVSTSPGPSAVLMAASNAVGKRLEGYPLTPDKILKALGKIKT